MDAERLLATLLEVKRNQEEVVNRLKQFDDFMLLVREALASTIKEKDKLKSTVGIIEMKQKDMAVMVGKIEQRINALFRQEGTWVQ